MASDGKEIFLTERECQIIWVYSENALHLTDKEIAHELRILADKLSPKKRIGYGKEG